MTEKDRLKKAAMESFDKISDSEVFLSVFSENYKKDPVCLMQLAISIILDKPIFLLVVKGTVVPKGLIRVAAGYEFAEDSSDEAIHDASGRMMLRMQKYFEENPHD